MKSKVKRILSVVMTMCMLTTMVPLTAYGAETDFTDVAADVQDTEEEPAVSADEEELSAVDVDAETEEEADTQADTGVEIVPETESEAAEETVDETAGLSDDVEAEAFTDDADAAGAADLNTVYATTGAGVPAQASSFYKIVHVDCGRKYFSVSSLETIIDNAAKAGFNFVELAVGNDGLRFLLDDMSVTVDGTTYDSTSVTSAIKAGNTAYTTASTGELSQGEMDSIIAYASDKGVSIIPLINSPGHMDAILSAYKTLTNTSGAYKNSSRTVDVTNAGAVSFTYALIQKYISYFAGKGLKVFNMGADEYANDVCTGTGMGFGQLQSEGNYQYFVKYVNKMADMIKSSGMIPMAFNDGIYYNNVTSQGTFDTSILVSYWSNGWSGYAPASASTLAGMGFNLINTHGDYYWVAGKGQCSAETAAEFDYNTFAGGSTIESPAGAMFCIWCDYPGAETESSIIEKTASVMTAFGNTLPGASADEGGITGVPETALSVGDTVTLSLLGGVSGTWTSSDENVISLSSVSKEEANAQADSAEITGNQVNAAAVSSGTSTITAVAGDNTYSAEITVAVESAGDSKTVDVSLNVGESKEITAEGDVTSTVDKTNLDSSIASVKAVYEEAGTTSEFTKASEITSGGEYYISDGNGNYLSLSNGQLVNATDPSKATKWTITSSNSYYIVSSGNYYLRYNYGLTTTTYSWYATSWSYNSGSGLSYSESRGRSSTTYYLEYNNGWTASSSASSYASVGTLTEKETPAQTVVTVKGINAGTTSFKVGDVTYNVTVFNPQPTDSMTSTSISIEYWITNSQVWRDSTKAEHSLSISSSVEGITSDEGVDITTLVPAEGYANFDGDVTVYYWQAMRLDSDNIQTSDLGDDETADGSAFTHIRYKDGAWQYKTTDGTWNWFHSGDQLVAYYLRKTDVTKEIATYMKDWGYTFKDSTQTPYIFGGAGQVALSVAVVYEDGTLSPTESNIYLNSTTIFNYWSGRDIGIIAPDNNSDYEIAKITYTYGNRNDNQSSDIWYNTDSITWNKKTDSESGETWFDETTVWDAETNAGTTPVINGKTSNITWTAKNTGVLVLIYLKPIKKDSSLTVQYVDDSEIDADNNSKLIAETYVQMSYNQGSAVPTFITDLYADGKTKGSSAGDITLADDAYIVNSSGVNQTFNKKLETSALKMDAKYKSGLYTYVKAEISKDGKTLILHYNIDTTKTVAQYVVDFGLPVTVQLSDFMKDYNPDGVSSVEIASGTATASTDKKSITYEPAGVMTGIDVVGVKITYSDGSVVTPRVGFVPATTVYYEEYFVNGGTHSTSLKQTATRAGKAVGESQNYGKDSAYSSTSGASNGSQIDLKEAGKKTFTFTGTGVDIYANTSKNTGTMMVGVSTGTDTKKVVKVISVDTRVAAGTTTATTSNSHDTGYNVPVITLEGLTYGTYTLTLMAVKSQKEGVKDVYLDGFRVHDTIDTSASDKVSVSTKDIYESDGEANPEYVELRDFAITQKNTSGNWGTWYKTQIEKLRYSQVYKNNTNSATIINNLTTSDYDETQLVDLLENGPKNEVYLAKGSTIVFNLAIASQIGIKGVNGTASVTLNNTSMTVPTTDMFYKVNAGTVTIKNNGSTLLSITTIKKCS